MPINKKKYRSIFFDLDNTIWDFDKNSYESLKIAFHKNELQQIVSSFDDFYNRYITINEKLWSDYRNKKISKHQLIIERFKQTFSAFNFSHDPLSFNNDYLGAMPYQKVLFENTFEVLDYLKSKGYQLYIITNGFKEVQYKKLQKSGLAPYFKRVFVSEEVKSQKPNKEIFEYALKSTNSKKQFSIMIGDSWEVDIMGALNVGIDQVHFNFGGDIEISSNEKRNIEYSRTATYRINQLMQLQLIL